MAGYEIQLIWVRLSDSRKWSIIVGKELNINIKTIEVIGKSQIDCFHVFRYLNVESLSDEIDRRKSFV